MTDENGGEDIARAMNQDGNLVIVEFEVLTVQVVLACHTTAPLHSGTGYQCALRTDIC